ncbi:hypothetical protein DVH24_020109 [Malus domestica]|uniref:Uncharacterized protein n=1 Tax=Malus domestica TaxID=3750 RepID=A0A498J7D2_MALDO|nr:hypothetical protein DVH24_020109 [Malus domestica]
MALGSTREVRHEAGGWATESMDLDLIGTSQGGLDHLKEIHGTNGSDKELGCGQGGRPQKASFSRWSMDDEEHQSLKFDWNLTGWFRPPIINSWTNSSDKEWRAYGHRASSQAPSGGLDHLKIYGNRLRFCSGE